MRKFIIPAITALFATLSAGASAELSSVPLEYSAVNVDGNQASLYLEGYLPDSCYGDPRAEVEREADEINVYVVSDVQGEYCAEVITLFDLNVPLGKFAPGEYKVYLQPGTRYGSTLDFEIY